MSGTFHDNLTRTWVSFFKTRGKQGASSKLKLKAIYLTLPPILKQHESSDRTVVYKIYSSKGSPDPTKAKGEIKE